MSDKPTIALYMLTGVGLIIMCPSGVMFTNQTGGYACDHPQEEGVYMPLDFNTDKLEKYFFGGQYDGDCDHGIDQLDAGFLDDYLSKAGNIHELKLKVDRTRLQDCQEAWIYLDIENTGTEGDIVAGFNKCKGILTWENSD